MKIKADISAGLALSNLGDAYNATGAPEIAIGYYRKGLGMIGDISDNATVKLCMAKAFMQAGHPDSAMSYARDAFNRALSLKMAADVLATATEAGGGKNGGRRGKKS